MISLEQWRAAIGSFNCTQLLSNHTQCCFHSQYVLISYLIQCVLYAYMYVCVQYIVLSCVVKLAILSMSVNNLVFSHISYSSNDILLYYISMYSQYTIVFVCLVHSLLLFPNALTSSYNDKLCFQYKRIYKYTNQYCQRMIILCCFLQSCISMQLLLLCGDIETNPGPTTKVCPECSLSLHIKVSMCPCGYSFKSAKNVTTVCPQCSSLIHIKKLICLCGYTFETSHSNDCSVRALAMRKK